MKCILTRCVARILVACLLIDPATAAGLTLPSTSRPALGGYAARVESQALSVVPRYFRRVIAPSRALFLKTHLPEDIRPPVAKSTRNRNSLRWAALGGLLAGTGTLALISGHSPLLTFWGISLVASVLVSTEWSLPIVPKALSAYSRLLEGIGLRTPDWARMNALTAVVLEAAVRMEQLNLLDLEEAGVKKFEDLNIPADRQRVRPLLTNLVEAGVLREQADAYELAMPMEEAAIKMEAVFFIKTHIESTIHTGDPQPLKELILRYAKAAERWPLYPVENKTPVLKAIAVMSKEDKNILIKVLESDEGLRQYPLVDSIRILLEKQPPPNWLRRQAPSLEGKAIWSIAAEGWFPAGGLGRVQQYHSAAMKLLAGNAKTKVATIEAYYPYRVKVRPGEDDVVEKVDYSNYRDLATPIKDLQEIDSFIVKVQGKDVKAQIFKGTNEYGIDVYLIKDADDFYTKLMYRYGEHGAATWEEFSEFLSRASLELIRRTEQAKSDELGAESYNPPVIIANDGQLGLFPLFKRMLDEENPLLRKALVWFTTHTYRNRHSVGWKEGQEILERMQIPKKWWRYFDRIGQIDFSSVGVRLADGANAVSAVQRDEVALIDPDARLMAITNGDNRKATRKAYLKLWDELYKNGDSDSEDPTPEQLLKLKIIAKRRVRPTDPLEALQMVIAYFGRLVPEKFSLERASAPANIRSLILKAVQYLIYGNVQAPPISGAMYRDLISLEGEVNPTGPGKLIVNPSWTISEQIEALPATDIQIQDSERDWNMGTEAHGAMESNAPAVGAMEATTPYREGGLQAQGVLFDRALRFGDVIIPESESPEDYRKMLLTHADEYQKDPLAYAALQVQAMKFSQSTDACFTGMAYLRAFHQAIEWQENPLLAVQAFLRHEPEMDKYFTAFWVRNNLANYLQAHPDIAKPFKTEGVVEAYVVQSQGEEPYVLIINRDEVVERTVMGTVLKKWIKVLYEVTPFRKLFGWDFGVNPYAIYKAVDLRTGVTYDLEHSIGETVSHGWDFGIPWPGIQAIKPEIENVSEKILDGFTSTETLLFVRTIWQHSNDPQTATKELFDSILNLSKVDAHHSLGTAGMELVLGALAAFGTAEDLDRVIKWNPSEVQVLKNKLAAGRNAVDIISYTAEFLRQMLQTSEGTKLLDVPFRQPLAAYLKTLSQEEVKHLSSSDPDVEIFGYADRGYRYIVAVNIGKSDTPKTRFVLDDAAKMFLGPRFDTTRQIAVYDLVAQKGSKSNDVGGIEIYVPAARILRVIPNNPENLIQDPNATNSTGDKRVLTAA